MIISHPNYVKKVVFPLDKVSWMALFSSLMHLLARFGAFFVFCFLTGVKTLTGTLLISIILTPPHIFVTWKTETSP